ncbi:hypothetical protein C8035_v008705 [Colletotrichum spinosum]|uniref:Uncharacterized protein n=1 Tax=Colletotrichum spinosum TaxID=1347390 RepID=A0A4R8PQQ4_9PEZI|nr:hypothetical protein C8035_v008705 [Colletotrichum spinosum]
MRAIAFLSLFSLACAAPASAPELEIRQLPPYPWENTDPWPKTQQRMVSQDKSLIMTPLPGGVIQLDWANTDKVWNQHIVFTLATPEGKTMWMANTDPGDVGTVSFPMVGDKYHLSTSHCTK